MQIDSLNALPTAAQLADRSRHALRACGVDLLDGVWDARSPINGCSTVPMPRCEVGDVDVAVERAGEAFRQWRRVPAPARGQIVARLRELLIEHKSDLAELVTIEVGKIRSEAMGEIQEMIDICDLAVGLSRQLFGRTMPSERPGHRLMETWHPLGVVGVVTAFNFPAAVWSWNSALALVCGDPVVWKPSEMAGATALGVTALMDRAIADCGAPPHLHQLLLGGADVGEALIDHPGVALVSATGSTNMGRVVGPRVANRFGRSLLELGGNNAAIVAPSADLDLAVRGIVFAAAGTAGQRCTTMRRVIAHESVADSLVDRLAQVYARLPIGDPSSEQTLVGPLIHERAFDMARSTIDELEAEGAHLVVGGERLDTPDSPAAYYMRPSIARVAKQTAVVRRETFAPLLHVLTYSDLDEAIELNNDVPQGLSSSIFTQDLGEAERFMSAEGSDCGIVNVNIGTSGAEIGGAFGGEKETGGGRESGSDAWRNYMRRATNTINYSGALPLAQGVDFSV